MTTFRRNIGEELHEVLYMVMVVVKKTYEAAREQSPLLCQNQRRIAQAKSKTIPA